MSDEERPVARTIPERRCSPSRTGMGAGRFEPTGGTGVVRYSPAAGMFVTVYGGYDAPTTLEIMWPDGSTVAVIQEP